MDHDLLHPIEDHELRERKLPKIIWKILAFIFLSIFVTYFVTTPRVLSMIPGLLASETLEANQIQTDYGIITFDEDILASLIGLYHANEKEFKACLLGHVDEEGYIINELFLPKIYEQDYDHVVSAGCPNETLLDLHSHPQQHCTFSAQDRNSFNPEDANTLLTVMCNDQRFIFFRK